MNVSTCMLTSIAIGIAVDDTVHVIVRFRREIEIDGNYERAVRATFVGVGPPVLFTSVILCAGFLVLTASQFRPNIYFGVLTSFTMATALIADLLILPVCLYLLRPRATATAPEA
jgi:predicted RND superfamily exporter protein